jgi:hypothetical protein
MRDVMHDPDRRLEEREAGIAELISTVSMGAMADRYVWAGVYWFSIQMSQYMPRLLSRLNFFSDKREWMSNKNKCSAFLSILPCCRA